MHRQPIQRQPANNNNLSINRSVVESSRLGPVNNRGRRPPQRRPSLEARPEHLDRFEHRRPIVPVSNSINTAPIRENLSHNRQITRIPVNSVPESNSNLAQPIGNSLTGSSRQIVPISNSIVQPNNSPINSLISNPISSSIPINHLAPANSFIPINNNLPFDKRSLNAYILSHNNLSTTVGSAQPNNNPIVNPVVASSPIAKPILNQNSHINAPISNSIANTNSITNNLNSNAINKPVVRGRQSAGILEFNTKPERVHAARPRPRPEHVHHPASEHTPSNSINSSNRGRVINSRSQSRATRTSTETSVAAVAKEVNSVDQNVSGGGSEWGQRLG